MITILISNINKRQIDVNNIHSGEVRAAKSALEKPEDNSLQVSIKTSDFFSYIRYELICIRVKCLFYSNCSSVM